jgi:hypothetical protein
MWAKPMGKEEQLVDGQELKDGLKVFATVQISTLVMALGLERERESLDWRITTGCVCVYLWLIGN